VAALPAAAPWKQKAPPKRGFCELLRKG